MYQPGHANHISAVRKYYNFTSGNTVNETKLIFPPDRKVNNSVNVIELELPNKYMQTSQLIQLLQTL